MTEPRHRGEGECYKCKIKLGWYDSKWLEQDGEKRMVCYDCGYAKGYCHGVPSEEHRGWWYFTDG